MVVPLSMYLKNVILFNLFLSYLNKNISDWKKTNKIFN